MAENNSGAGGGRGSGRGGYHNKFYRGRGGGHNRRGSTTPRGETDVILEADSGERSQRSNSNNSRRGGRGGRGSSRGGVQLFAATDPAAPGERRGGGRGGHGSGGPVRRNEISEARSSPPRSEVGSPVTQRPNKGGSLQPATASPGASRWQQQRQKKSKPPKRNRIRTTSIGVGTDREEEDSGWARHAPKPRIEASAQKSQSAGSAKTTRSRPAANACTPPPEDPFYSSSDDGRNSRISDPQANKYDGTPQGSLHLCQYVHWTDGNSTTMRTLRDLLADDSPVLMEADTPVMGPQSTTGPVSMSPSMHSKDVLPPATSMAVDSVATPNTFKILHCGVGPDRHFSALGGDVVFGGSAPESGESSSVEPAGLPPAAVQPTMPRVDLFNFLMQDYNPRDNTFKWHTTEAGRGRMFGAVCTLVSEAIPLLKQRPLLRHVQAPAHTLGDIHGNFQDLQFFVKSLLTFGDIRLTTTHILCLGDYVDRGEHSLECLVLLLSLFVIAPDKVTLLRGNHEDRVVCGDKNNYGTMCFYGQCEAVFGAQVGRRLFANVTRVFQHFPLSVILESGGPIDPETGTSGPGGRALCTHGGFPRFNCDPLEDDQLKFLQSKDFPRFLTLFPNNPLSNMSDVEGLPATMLSPDSEGSNDGSGTSFAAAVASAAGSAPQTPTEEDLALSWTAPGATPLTEERHQRAWFSTFDMMWSDPTLEDEGAGVDSWGFGRSTRGQAVVCFTSQAVETFLGAHKCNMLFRAHQEKAHGIRLSKSSKVLTIFSSSNYLGHGNGAGCAIVSPQGEVRLVVKSGEEQLMFQETTSD